MTFFSRGNKNYLNWKYYLFIYKLNKYNEYKSISHFMMNVYLFTYHKYLYIPTNVIFLIKAYLIEIVFL